LTPAHRDWISVAQSRSVANNPLPARPRALRITPPSAAGLLGRSRCYTRFKLLLSPWQNRGNSKNISSSCYRLDNRNY
jgi:hypothetical protein